VPTELEAVVAAIDAAPHCHLRAPNHPGHLAFKADRIEHATAYLFRGQCRGSFLAQLAPRPVLFPIRLSSSLPLTSVAKASHPRCHHWKRHWLQILCVVVSPEPVVLVSSRAAIVLPRSSSSCSPTSPPELVASPSACHSFLLSPSHLTIEGLHW
jgi:hypothetical protein